MEINSNKMQNNSVFESIVNIYSSVPELYTTYMSMGRYYGEHGNVNQAYLCYEHAKFLCDNETIIESIEKDMESCRQDDRFMVNPVSFVILSYNSKDIMTGCIESIRKNCAPGSYEIVVVDNASTDGVREWLKEQSDIKLALNEKNSGFAAGNNQGVKLASPNNDIMLLNNDTIVTENSMLFLRLGLYEDVGIGAAGPMTSYALNGQRVDDNDYSTEEWLEIGKGVNKPSIEANEDKSWLVGFAVLIKRMAWDIVGGLDTRFGYGFYEDSDYGLRMNSNGFRTVLCHNSFIYHYGSVSMKKNLEETMRAFEFNKRLLNEKWGFNFEIASRAKNDYVRYIERNRYDEFSVLEVGCGLAATMSLVRYNFPNAHVYGVEKKHKVAEIAGNYSEVLCGEIEDNEVMFEQNSFDYIFVANDFEKFDDPVAALRKLKGMLKPDGKILMNQRNPLYGQYMLEIFRGRFFTSNNRNEGNDIKKLYSKTEAYDIIARAGLVTDYRIAIAVSYEDKEEDAKALEMIKELEGMLSADESHISAYLWMLKK